MLKKLLGLLMVAALNVVPNTVFAAGAPVGDGQEEVYGGGGTAGATDNEEISCGICMERLNLDDADRPTTAVHPLEGVPAKKHRFHRDCLTRWANVRKACPFCNVSIDDAIIRELFGSSYNQEMPEINVTPDDISKFFLLLGILIIIWLRFGRSARSVKANMGNPWLRHCGLLGCGCAM